MAVLGAVAGIGADYEAAGRTAGETTAAILKGAPPWELPRTHMEDQVAWINLATVEHLGLEPSDEVLGYFDRRISRSDGEHGA